MVNTNFNLRKQNENGKKAKEPQIIYLVVRWEGKKLVYSTGMKVLPHNWDPEKQCVKNVIAEKNKDIINAFLKDLSQETQTIYTKAKAERQPITKEFIKSALDLFTNKESEDKSLLSFIEKYIEGSPKRMNPQTGKFISPRTIQKYNTTFELLKDFAKTSRRPVDFCTIDMLFYEEFTAYMVSVKQYQLNTIGKHVSILKDWLNEATRKGLNTKMDYKTKAFKAPSVESFAVYSNESELLKVYDLDLSQNKRLERVRDLFIIGAFTGLRFSDFTNIQPEHIKESTIELHTQKTSKKVVVPIHWTVKQILSKNNGRAPESISNQKMNNYIKEVYKAAGITEKVEVLTTKGGIKAVQFVEKFDLISTHTARRSFATNAYLRGVPAQSIIKITGHKTEKAFLKYLRLDNSEHAAIVSDIWQNNPPLRAVK